MTIEEALAQHPGHWAGGWKVAVLNNGGDLLLITRSGMTPSRVDRITGSDKKKVDALEKFMPTSRRAAA